MNRGTLLVRADASAEIGVGHVMRSLALAQAWKLAGGRVVFACAALPASLAARLKDEGMTLREIAQGAAALGALAKEVSASWVIVDGYGFGTDYQVAARGAGARVLVIDDDGVAGEYVAELVLDPNAFAAENRYEKRAPYTRLLMGPSHAPLRREIAAGPPPTRATMPDTGGERRVLFSFGGADPAGTSLLALESLSRCKTPFDSTLVVGAANARRAEIEKAARGVPHLRLVFDASDMRALMTWADLAVVAAGGTCLELAYLGVPAIVVVTAENQRRVADAFVARGTAVSVGDAASLTARTLALTIDRLFAIDPQREEMGVRGRALVDGRGADRVLAAMEESS